MALFEKVLVANRGEIAVRIFRSLRELGIGSVGVYSDADRGDLHVSSCDEAYLIGPGRASESYLDQVRVIEAAKRAGAEAIHPGYGFLAENASFARACVDAGMVWIGPPAAAIEAMGSKVAARELMSEAGVPIVPGTTAPVESAGDLVQLGEELGWPLAVKASAGGGGKGLRVVSSPDDAERALASAKREGEAYFADSTVYVERYIEDPRHVEVQILADERGNVIHLGERDCTIQRRHQKLVEETPSPAVTDDLRRRIGQLGVDAASAVGYRGAGTIEGLLDLDGNYYFLEMNTRIQVEHTVTEAVTGIDIVRQQILIAAGEELSFGQVDVRFSGHAIECRINAEDPANGFLPSPGLITAYKEPGGPGVRVDSGIGEGREISGLYDPLAAKLIVHDIDRESARRRMLRALDEFVIEGPKTLIGFHKALLSHQCFTDGETCNGLVESAELADAVRAFAESRSGKTRSRSSTQLAGRALDVEVDGRRFEVRLLTDEPPHLELARRRERREQAGGGRHEGAKEAVVSPMQGTVLAVDVEDGQEVRAGEVLCVIEAMKMENEITAHRHGLVTQLSVSEGASVSTGQVICLVAQEADGARDP